MKTDRFTVGAITVIILAFIAGLIVLEETGKGADARALVQYILTASSGLGVIGTTVAYARKLTTRVDTLHTDIGNGLIEGPVRKAVQDVISPRPSELRTRAEDPSPPGEGSSDG